MRLGRFLALASALGLAVGVLLTWPLVLHMQTQVLEDGTLDAFQFAWNLWWVRESLLELHRHPFSTNHLFYPNGVPLLFHTGSFALGFITLPLQLLAGVLVTENVLVLTAPALTLVAVALLAREITGDPWAALVAGLLGAITPFAIWVMPVIYLSCAWIPPAMLWAWWVLQRRRQPLLVFVLLGFLIFSVFASQEFAMMAVTLLGMDTALRVVFGRSLNIPPVWWRGTIAFFGIGGVALGSLAVYAILNPAQPPHPTQAMLGSGYVLGFFVPGWLMWPPVTPFKFAAVYYLGTLSLVLGYIGLRRGGRPAMYGALLLVPLLLMVMGPFLHLWHPFFSLPPKGEVQPTSGLPGVYQIAGRFFPLLKFLRAPYRWMTAANPMLAVMAAAGVAAMRAKAAEPQRTRLTAALLVAAFVIPLAETIWLRAPLKEVPVPSAYQVITADPQESALIDLPSGFTAGGWALQSSRYMYFQTVHGKYLLEGTVSRLPLGLDRVVGRKITDFARLPFVKYVVVHRDLLPDAMPAAQEQTNVLVTLAQQQGRLIANDDQIDVYQLNTFQPETVWSPRTRALVSAPPSATP